MVKEEAAKLHASGKTTIDAIKLSLQGNDSLSTALKSIRKLLKNTNAEKWEAVNRSFYPDIVRSVMPDNIFPNGGDRCSATYKNSKQRDVVAFVETKAAEAPENADEDTVVTDCTNAVLQRWKTASNKQQSMLSPTRDRRRSCGDSPDGAYCRSSCPVWSYK